MAFLSSYRDFRELPQSLPSLPSKGFAMPSTETSPLARRVLNLSVVAILACFYFLFFGMGIYTKFGPGPFRCPQNSWLHFFGVLSRLTTLGELVTTTQRPLILCSAKYSIRFLCSSPHVRLLQVPVRHPSGCSSPSRGHGCPHRQRLAALEKNHVMRGMHKAARTSLRASLSAS